MGYSKYEIKKFDGIRDYWLLTTKKMYSLLVQQDVAKGVVNDLEYLGEFLVFSKKICL